MADKAKDPLRRWLMIDVKNTVASLVTLDDGNVDNTEEAVNDGLQIAESDKECTIE